MFAKDMSNKKFSPLRHQDTKLNIYEFFFLLSSCLCGSSFRFIRVGFLSNDTYRLLANTPLSCINTLAANDGWIAANLKLLRLRAYSQTVYDLDADHRCRPAQ
jgi:hypothetical protein